MRPSGEGGPPPPACHHDRDGVNIKQVEAIEHSQFHNTSSALGLQVAMFIDSMNALVNYAGLSTKSAKLMSSTHA